MWVGTLYVCHAVNNVLSNSLVVPAFFLEKNSKKIGMYQNSKASFINDIKIVQ